MSDKDYRPNPSDIPSIGVASYRKAVALADLYDAVKDYVMHGASLDSLTREFYNCQRIIRDKK
jgi:hypothetical protein